MKKYLFFVFVLFISFIGVANAYYYPEDHGSIKIDDNYIRKDKDTINNDLVNGATYDEATNTLTLDNVSINILTVEDMGESFKLKLVGINTIKRINIIGDIYIDSNDKFYTTYLHIIGDGTLIIRRESNYEHAIDIWNGRLIIDSSVNVILDKEEGYNHDNLMIVTSTSKSISHAIHLDGRNAVEGTTDFFRDIDNTSHFYLTVTFDKIIDYTKIYEKDSKKYVVENYDGNEYKLYLKDIKTYTYNGKTYKYVDVLDFYHMYTLEELREEGYVETNDSYEVYEFHDAFLLEKYDSVGNRYYVDTNNNNKIFKYTGEVIIGGVNNYEHPFILADDTVALSSLERNAYKHYVNEDVFMSKFKTYNAVSGKDQKYIYGGEGISFRFDAPYSVFENGGKVYLDDEELTDFTSKEGSTIITLDGELLDTLSEGVHTLSIEYSDSRTSSVSFTVSEQETESESESKSKNPKTEDNLLLYLNLLIISIFVLMNINRKVKE